MIGSYINSSPKGCHLEGLVPISAKNIPVTVAANIRIIDNLTSSKQILHLNILHNLVTSNISSSTILSQVTIRYRICTLCNKFNCAQHSQCNKEWMQKWYRHKYRAKQTRQPMFAIKGIDNSNKIAFISFTKRISYNQPSERIGPLMTYIRWNCKRNVHLCTSFPHLWMLQWTWYCLDNEAY